MSAPPSQPARHFLVGCPRSGTTLLQALLTRHAGLTTFPETHFFAVCYNARLPILLGWSGRRALRRAARVADLEVKAPASATVLLGRPEPYIAAFIAALDERTTRAGDDGWLEKTPRHVFFAEQISRTVPRARFVHLLRDGRATVASLYDVARTDTSGVWQRYRSLDYCIERWNRSVRASLRWQGRPGHHFVRYEDVTRDSAAALSRLCAELGLTYLAQPRPEAAGLAGFTEEYETWKAGAGLEIHDYGLAKYERLFDADQRRRVEAGLIDVAPLGAGGG